MHENAWKCKGSVLTIPRQFEIETFHPQRFRAVARRTGSVCLITHTRRHPLWFCPQKYLSRARKELKGMHPPVVEEDDLLRHALERKIKSSAEADTTSEEWAWFNETDRLIQSIVKVEEGRRHGHGQMVVMRVYAVDAQLSMRRCLREAVTTLGLHDGSPKHPLFSVMLDNGSQDTSLYNDIEEYFREDFNLSDAGAGGHPYTLSDRLKELDAPRVTQKGRHKPLRASLSYADLRNVPMILILVDKGRTGDTFPHSLGYFDLRIRTVTDSYATFKQELGRLCRYQTFRPIEIGGITGCSPKEARKRLIQVSVSSRTDGRAPPFKQRAIVSMTNNNNVNGFL